MKPRALAPLLLVCVLLLPASSVSADDLIVDNDKLQCPSAQFTTIQSAVTVAATMLGTQKIRICAGNCPENVLIPVDSDTRFEIFGDGVEKVFVTGPPIPTPGPIFDAVNVTQGVAIEKLTVDGRSAMIGNPIGIRFEQPRAC